MAVSKPVKVPPAKISSLDIISFDAGLDQRGVANIRSNSFGVGRNVMVNSQGLATQRYVKKHWLPDTVDTVYQVAGILWNGETVYYTADEGKMKWCTDSSTEWTDCAGDAVTNVGNVNTFTRIKNVLLIHNGVDTLGYVDLATKTVYHYTKVDDPTVKPTSALVGLTTGSIKHYYAIRYNGRVGMTKLTPIVTVLANKIRDQWKTDGTEGITITDPNVRDPDALSWNLYYAATATGATIQPEDMLPLMVGIDMSTTSFTDNGSIQFGVASGVTRDINTTEGPKATYGVEFGGRPFLYGNTDDPYEVLIGGDGDNALDFSITNGGQSLLINDGTNYYPMSVVGFRSGQGIPSITALSSSIDGMGKQSIIEQNTLSLGSDSRMAWGATEQNYGAAGMASPYAGIQYQGRLIFPTTNGILQLNTQASLQNVLLPQLISDPISETISSIKTSKLGQIVGTAWNNKALFTVATAGFDKNNKIVVYDMTRGQGNECWYTFDVSAQWLGTVSPGNSSGFVYLCEDNHIYRLVPGYVAQDDSAVGTVSFPVSLTSAMVGSNAAHSGYYAVVQVTFYLVDFIGSVDLSVSYRDYQSGEMLTEVMTVTNGSYTKSSVGNWSSPGYLFNQALPTKVLKWSDSDTIQDVNNSGKTSQRYSLPLNNVVTNELQATINTSADNSSFIARSISFEGQPLGISPDIR